MSNKSMQRNTKHSALNESIDGTPQKNRRRLLKCAVAVPVVMTLHSGAAMAARTSNLVGSVLSSEDAQKMNYGNGDQLLCVHPDTTKTQIYGGPYDLGDPPMASLGKSEDAMSEQVIACQNVDGIMISATAFSSIQDKLVINVTTL